MARLARRQSRSFVFRVALSAALSSILPLTASAWAGASGVSRLAAGHDDVVAIAANQDWPAYLFSARHPSATAGPAAITPGNAGSLKVDVPEPYSEYLAAARRAGRHWAGRL